MFVTALKSFDHNGKVDKGQPFTCDELTARKLKRAGLVTFEEPVNFPMAGALLPSALPPVPALPQTIAKPLEDGELPKLKKKPGRKKKP